MQATYHEPELSEVCRAYDEVLQQAQLRLSLAVPWVSSNRSDACLTAFIQGVATVVVPGCEVRACLRPVAAERSDVVV